jgi:hypothetical protein
LHWKDWLKTGKIGIQYYPMPSPESLIEMAQADRSGSKPESTPRPPKTQEELRKTLEKRFGTLTSSIQSELSTYENMVAQGSFDDTEGEEAGAGDKRREAYQTKIEHLMSTTEKMKKTLDSKEPLPQSTPVIKTTYSYTNPQTKAIEHQETITLDIEHKNQEFLDFYKKTGIDIPADFRDTILTIWEKNSTEIQEAIEQHGFNDILLVPGNIPLTELAEKMKMEKGYFTGSNFDAGGGFAGAKSDHIDTPRLILVHKTQNLKDRPELASTRNIKGQDVNLDQILTLEDYLVFQRKYFEETQNHLDEDGWTWLATKSGARLVSSRWHPDHGKLLVRARVLDYQHEALGARPSRSFF